ncbi:MAG: hypothetical protein KatS3mg010_1966 [Acidimicrobiia bacterium]|nr:MAG: hypothetical protein KatS3mg010_1966 [Acidimicrobiia bacterium]
MRSTAASTNVSTRLGSSCFGQRRARPGLDVHHAEPALHLHDARLRGVLGARVDVAVDAGARECAGQRPHVHVHPAAVARAGLRQRGRVHAEHGDPAYRHRTDRTQGFPADGPAPRSARPPAAGQAPLAASASRPRFSTWKDR